jgi:hypothetical protein
VGALTSAPAWIGAFDVTGVLETALVRLVVGRLAAAALPWLAGAGLMRAVAFGLPRWLLLLPALPALPVLLPGAALPPAFAVPVPACAPALFLLDSELAALAVRPATVLPPLAALPLLPPALLLLPADLPLLPPVSLLP